MLYYHSFERSVLVCLMLSLSINLAACNDMNNSTTDDNRQLIMEEIGTNRSEYASGSFVHQGYERTYYLHTPISYNPQNPIPLVLAFHGGFGFGKRFADITSFNALADREGFIVVYPDGINGHWNDGRQIPRVHPEIDDVSFVAELIEHLQEIRNINSRRIYATGISNGGMFTQRLACELSDRIAAFAPVSSAMPIPLKENCTPQRPVPILLINGLNDPILRWEGGQISKAEGGEILSVPQTIEFWRQHNACSQSATVEQLPDYDRDDGTLVEALRYSGCQQESIVVFLLVRGGGHSWPGSAWRSQRIERITGKTSRDINASQVIWEFLQQQQLPEINRVVTKIEPES